MPVPDQISVDLPIETFGGRVTQYDAQQLPPGASPFNQDVIFSDVDEDGTGLVAGFGSRPGLGSGFYPNPLASNPTVNYLKTFQDTSGVFHTLLLGVVGLTQSTFYDETPSGSVPTNPAQIGTSIAPKTSLYTQSETLLGREWLAISDGNYGIDIPRQYDGTNFDRVSQSGPGAPPSVSDYTGSFNILTTAGLGIIPFSYPIESISQTGFVVTAVVGGGAIEPLTTTGHTVKISGVTADARYNGTFSIASVNLAINSISYNLSVSGLPAGGIAGTAGTSVTSIFPQTILIDFPAGSLATIAGATNATYDGTWVVLGIFHRGLSNALVVNIPAAAGLASSDSGTITAAGNISAGTHLVAVCFVTREGYITKPSPYNSWVSAGNLAVNVTNIPIGPANVVARILIFTPVITPPATFGPFFYFGGSVATPSAGTFPSMIIQDNTSTSYLVDFNDTSLQLGTAATNLFNLLVLGECSHMAGYSGRTVWIGERNKLSNVLNMDFEGGWNLGDGLGGSDVPLGWNSDPTSGAGGSRNAGGGWYMDGYDITGDGVTAIRGMITQPFFQDVFGVQILDVNVSYSVRVRIVKENGFTVGSVVIDLFSPTAGVLGTFQVGQNNIPTSLAAEFIGVLCAAQAVIPPDTVLRLYVNGTPVAASFVIIDCLEVYPTAVPINRTQARLSYALDPESFDQSSGIIQVDAGSGEDLRSVFGLLDNKLYFVRDRSIFSTQDDGQNEPDLWTLNTVSDIVGTPSPNGVGIGESWAVIAHKDGLYIFWGSEPVKISQEIQPDWDSINWNFGYTIYVVVDTHRKRIHVGAPVGVATTPNVEFVLDYSQLANSEGAVSAQDIVAHPQAYYSSFQPTKLVAPGKARKWTIWNISCNSAAVTIRSDGSYHLLRGNGVGNGKVYDMVPANTNDDGTTIQSEYQTYYFPDTEQEQMLQLGSHRKMCKYLTGYASGSGTLSFTLFGSKDQRGLALSSLTLANPAVWDFEKNVNFVAERMSLLVQISGVQPSAWFRIAKMCPTIQRDVMTPVRGTV